MTTAAGEAWKNVAGYAAAVAASVAAAAVVLQLWRADLRIPFFYSGDNLMGQMFVQNVLDGGWVFDNGRLGAPAHWTCAITRSRMSSISPLSSCSEAPVRTPPSSSTSTTCRHSH